MITLKELVSRLRNVADICRSTKADLSFEEAEVVAQFYHDCQNTNAVIDAAEEMAQCDPVGLKDIMSELAREAQQALKVLPNIDGIDFNKVGTDYSDRFYDAFNEASKANAPLRKRIYNLNNRLDYLPLDSEDYVECEKELEEAKAELEPRQKEVEAKYAIYEKEHERSADVRWFKPEYLEVLIVKLGQIADAVLADLNRAGV